MSEAGVDRVEVGSTRIIFSRENFSCRETTPLELLAPSDCVLEGGTACLLPAFLKCCLRCLQVQGHGRKSFSKHLPAH